MASRRYHRREWRADGVCTVQERVTRADGSKWHIAKKVTAKGPALVATRFRHSDWFGISSQTVSSPPPLDWHSTSADGEFSRFSTGLPMGNPTRVSAFTIERRVEGTDGTPVRRGYPRFAEQASKFPVQFGCTRFRIPVPVTHRMGWNMSTSARVTRYTPGNVPMNACIALVRCSKTLRKDYTFNNNYLLHFT